MEGLTEGRIVHYVLKDVRNEGEHRPAIVVRDWSKSGVASYPDGTVNLQVFTDGYNDSIMEFIRGGTDKDSGTTRVADMMWRTSVHYSENKEPGTWHWIEKA